MDHYCLDTGPLLDVTVVAIGEQASEEAPRQCVREAPEHPYLVEGFETFLTSSLPLLTTLACWLRSIGTSKPPGSRPTGTPISSVLP